MKVVAFNLTAIASIDDFYQQVSLQLNLPHYFGKNQDALWDCLTSGEIKLPITIVFYQVQNKHWCQKMTNLFNNVATFFDDTTVFCFIQK